MSGPPDEFDWIASLRPLTRGDPRALDLMDDVAVLPARPGFDLVVSEDAMVEGVHFVVGEAPDTIARRLLRTALSDLAAKAAEPFGYLLMTAWPDDRDRAWRDAFREGLAADGARFEMALLGGDTVAARGALTLSATVFGWVPSGAAVLRSGATAGDTLIVCGAIGDGRLGLLAVRGELPDPSGRLAQHYRTPEPLLSLREPIRAYAKASADVSDGLLADAWRIAEASGLGLDIDLDALPFSVEGVRWRDAQPDRVDAALTLATAGDDYAVVCALESKDESAFVEAATSAGVPVARIGRFVSVGELQVNGAGGLVTPDRLGWRH